MQTRQTKKTYRYTIYIYIFISKIFKEVPKGSEAQQDNTTWSKSSPLDEEKVKVIRSLTQERLKLVQDHLKKHNLWGKNVPLKPDIELKLPEFEGWYYKVNEHFYWFVKTQLNL